MVLGRWNHVPASFSFLRIASDDGERLSQNPLQVLLLCVGKTAIMYAKSVQREDCIQNHSPLDAFPQLRSDQRTIRRVSAFRRLPCRLGTRGNPENQAPIGKKTTKNQAPLGQKTSGMQTTVGGKALTGTPQLLLHLRCPRRLFPTTSTLTKPLLGKVLMSCTSKCSQQNGPANRAWRAAMSPTSLPMNSRIVD